MLDIEIASAMEFLIENSGNPSPYYWNIPQDFVVPAVFFPQPEIRSSGDTFSTYALEFSWFVKFFAKDTGAAHSLGFASLTALNRARGNISLIGEDGNPTGRTFRIDDPSLRIVDDGAVQLTLMWDSRRPYHQEEYEQMAEFQAEIFVKSSFENAVNMIDGG